MFNDCFVRVLLKSKMMFCIWQLSWNVYAKIYVLQLFCGSYLVRYV